MTTLDLEFIRKQFPAFQAEGLQGQAFFENAGGSYMCQQVIDRFDRYFRERKVQPYGAFQASIEAGAEMDQAHDRLAQYLNVGRDEVMFGPSTSQNIYVLAQGFTDCLKSGAQVIVSEQEHEANSGVWRNMQKRGINVTIWPLDPESGRLNRADLMGLMTDQCRIIAMTQCSNIVAEIHDVRAVADLAHQAGAILVVDGVSHCPHGLPDVEALGADVYLFSLYKTYGPHQGAMVIRKTARDWLAPQGHFFNHDIPEKYMVPAGPDHAQIAASNGVFDYFDAVDAHHGGANDSGRPQRVARLFRQAEQDNLKPMLDYLSSRNDIRMLGPTDANVRAATVSFVSMRHESARLAESLAERGIMTRAGNFYAVRTLQALGIDPQKGVLRLSFVHYTSRDEIDQALNALDQLL